MVFSENLWYSDNIVNKRRNSLENENFFRALCVPFRKAKKRKEWNLIWI